MKLIGSLERDLDRLFNDHVLARPDRDQRGLQMRSTRRGDADHVHVRMRCELRNIRRGEDRTLLLGEALRFRQIATRHADQPGSVDVSQRLRMKLGDHADANNAKTERT